MNDAIHIIDLIETAICGCWSIAIVLFASEIGQRFNNGFVRIDDKINEFDWYLLPMNIKRMLPTMMINAQQPIYINCFGSLTCSRETFKKVCP